MTNDEIAGAAARRVAAQMFDYDGRKATILTAIEDALTESRRARIGDSEIIGREMCRAEKAEAEVAALRQEMRQHVQQRITTRCPSCGHQSLFIGSGGHLTCSWLECKDPGIERAIEKRKASPPAPSGWQQRIAAMPVGASYIHVEIRDETSAVLDSFNLDAKEVGQGSLPNTLNKAGAATSALAAPLANAEADASPDPIADAVHAQLDPLKAELIKAGHKLAKDGGA